MTVLGELIELLLSSTVIHRYDNNLLHNSSNITSGEWPEEIMPIICLFEVLVKND